MTSSCISRYRSRCCYKPNQKQEFLKIIIVFQSRNVWLDNGWRLVSNPISSIFLQVEKIIAGLLTLYIILPSFLVFVTLLDKIFTKMFHLFCINQAQDWKNILNFFHRTCNFRQFYRFSIANFKFFEFLYRLLRPNAVFHVFLNFFSNH